MSAAASITLLSDSTDQYVDNYVMDHFHQQTRWSQQTNLLLQPLHVITNEFVTLLSVSRLEFISTKATFLAN